MKILLLDIETSPLTAFAWGLRTKYINPSNIIDSGRVLCWAAKWLGESQIYFDSNYRNNHDEMIRNIHALLDEADAIIHYNGSRFDIPTLNKEFLLAELPPPSPHKDVDLLKTTRQVFRFHSNKLDYIGQELGIGEKTHHTGFKLWVDCMDGKRDAWKIMEEYNVNDVVLLEELYERLKPWIKDHPNRSVFAGHACCPTCGSSSYQRRGYYQTLAGRYQRYQCLDCSKWFRIGTSEAQPPAQRSTGVT